MATFGNQTVARFAASTLASTTLYLSSSVVPSPYPSTSRMLVEAAPAAPVNINAGEFDTTLPGGANAGTFVPGLNRAATTAATEVANPVTTAGDYGATRPGWLWDVDMSGIRLLVGQAFSFTLRLQEYQSTATNLTGRPMVRISVVTAGAGTWNTARILTPTRVSPVDAGYPRAGQAGWCNSNEAGQPAITVTPTAANFTWTVALAAEHVFQPGERLLFELGFGTASSTTDRSWRLIHNDANSRVVTPQVAQYVVTQGGHYDDVLDAFGFPVDGYGSQEVVPPAAPAQDVGQAGQDDAAGDAFGAQDVAAAVPAQDVGQAGHAEGADAAGAQSVSAVYAAAQAGFAEADGFGAQAAVPGAVAVSQSGLDDAAGDGHGAQALAAAYAASQAGHPDGDAFGAPATQPGTVPVGQAGLDDAAADAFGAQQAVPGPAAVSQAGHAGEDAHGGQEILPGPAAVAQSALDDAAAAGDLFGAAAVASGGLPVGQAGFGDGDAHGAQSVVPGAAVLWQAGLADAPEGWGAQILLPGAAALAQSGFADPDLFGAQSSLAPGTVGLAAFADPDRFGEVRLWARHAPGRYAGARGARGHAAPRPRTGVGGP